MKLFLIFILAAVLLSFTEWSMAQGAESQGLTAQEYYANAERLFAEGKFSGAADLYEKFVADFGGSKDAAEAIRRIRFRHAMCFVHMKKFGGAIGPIQTALEQQPPLGEPEVQELLFWLGVANMEARTMGMPARILKNS